MIRKEIFFWSTLLLLLFTGNAWGARYQYAVTEICSEGTFFPFDINASGQMTGPYFINGQAHACIYGNGTMTDLGTLPNCSYAYSYDINDNGQLAGYSGNYSSSNHAFLYSGGEKTDLGILAGYSACVATGINSSGQITGYIYTSDVAYHAFIYRDRTMTDIGVCPGSYTRAYPQDINNRGEIVGHMSNNGYENRSFYYFDGQWKDLGTLGGSTCEATMINNLGQAVGASKSASGYEHGFVYQDGGLKDLMLPAGCRSSRISYINNKGIMVGSGSSFTNDSIAYSYADNQWIDLNSLIDPSSGWVLQSATAINDSNWIVGRGLHNGNACSFLLQPVPEPSTLALMLAASLGSLLCLRRRS